MNSAAHPIALEKTTVALLHLVIEFNLHPEKQCHSSWLPSDWPAPYRAISKLGPGGQSVLSGYLPRWGGWSGAFESNFDSRRRRVALMDSRSLRRLAFYCGLSTHKSLFEVRGLAPYMRRQAARIDQDAAKFVMDRVPALDRIVMDKRLPQKRPYSAGRLVINRGYRLLLAWLSEEGEDVMRKVRRKLPRRLSDLTLPQLQPEQIEQLSEVIFLCIIPERLPQWDWLF